MVVVTTVAYTSGHRGARFGAIVRSRYGVDNENNLFSCKLTVSRLGAFRVMQICEHEDISETSSCCFKMSESMLVALSREPFTADSLGGTA